MEAAHNDTLLSVGLLLLGGLFTALWWFIKSKFSSYDAMHGKHFEHATRPEIHQEGMSREAIELHFQSFNDRLDSHTREDARIEQDFQSHREEIRKTMHWISDSMFKIAAKMDVQLDKRPE